MVPLRAEPRRRRFVSSERGALGGREHMRRGQRLVGVIVEERRRPSEPAPPPAEKAQTALQEKPQRRRRRCVRGQRSDSRTSENVAQRRPEHILSRSAVRLAQESGDQADDREARAGRIGDRSPATFGVPAKDPAGEAQTSHGVSACGQLYPARRHMKNVRSARGVKHIRPLEETRECQVHGGTLRALWRSARQIG
jgi:hypothetical protein